MVEVSWLHDLLVIHRKTFTIIQQFETPYNNNTEKIRWKTFAIGGKSAKTAKVFHHKRFALYGILSFCDVISKHNFILFSLSCIIISFTALSYKSINDTGSSEVIP